MANEVFGDYTYTDDELNRMYENATRAGEEALKNEPRARKAWYDRASNRLVIDLINGSRIELPCNRIQGLKDADPDDIAAVTLTPFGMGLHWEKLDQDFSVAGLVRGIFGTKHWMAMLGRAGGRVSSKAKAAAARENGKRGGRPAKAKTATVGRRK